MSASDRLTARDHRCIEALLAGATQRQAAAHAGYSEATVRRRLREPRFLGELHRAEAAATAAVRRRLVASATGAVDRLRQAMTDQSVSPSVQVRAAARLLTSFVATLPRHVDIDGNLEVQHVDAEPIADRVRQMIAEVRANRAEASPDALAQVLSGAGHVRHAAEPGANGNGHHANGNGAAR